MGTLFCHKICVMKCRTSHCSLSSASRVPPSNASMTNSRRTQQNRTSRGAHTKKQSAIIEYSEEEKSSIQLQDMLKHLQRDLHDSDSWDIDSIRRASTRRVLENFWLQVSRVSAAETSPPSRPLNGGQSFHEIESSPNPAATSLQQESARHSLTQDAREMSGKRESLSANEAGSVLRVSYDSAERRVSKKEMKGLLEAGGEEASKSTESVLTIKSLNRVLGTCRSLPQLLQVFQWMRAHGLVNIHSCMLVARRLARSSDWALLRHWMAELDSSSPLDPSLALAQLEQEVGPLEAGQPSDRTAHMRSQEGGKQLGSGDIRVLGKEAEEAGNTSGLLPETPLKNWREGIKPDAPMYGCIISEAARQGNVEEVEKWIRRMLRAGLGPDLKAQDALLTAYATRLKQLKMGTRAERHFTVQSWKTEPAVWRSTTNRSGGESDVRGGDVCREPGEGREELTVNGSRVGYGCRNRDSSASGLRNRLVQNMVGHLEHAMRSGIHLQMSTWHSVVGSLIHAGETDVAFEVVEKLIAGGGKPDIRLMSLLCRALAGGRGARSRDETVAGARNPDKIIAGARNTDKTIAGARNTDKTIAGARSPEKIIAGARNAGKIALAIGYMQSTGMEVDHRILNTALVGLRDAGELESARKMLLECRPAWGEIMAGSVTFDAPFETDVSLRNWCDVSTGTPAAVAATAVGVLRGLQRMQEAERVFSFLRKAAMEVLLENDRRFTESMMVLDCDDFGWLPGALAIDPRWYCDHKLCAAMVTAYGDAGMVRRALELFEELSQEPWFCRWPEGEKLVVYNATMGVMLKGEDWEDLGTLFQKMQSADCDPGVNLVSCPQPDASTFTMLITARTQQGRLEEAMEAFSLARRCLGPGVDSALYGSMVKACMRAGVPQRAVGLVEEMLHRGIEVEQQLVGYISRALWRAGFVGEARELKALVKGNPT